MDSDVKKRRINRQKIARKRHLITGLIVFLVLILITLTIMSFTVFFKVEELEISANKIYTDEEIMIASGITTNDNLLAISEKKLENKMRKELPYIDKIDLKRKLPNKLIITVKDAEEYSFYKKKDSYFILSKNGYILKEQSEKPKELIELVTSGINGSVSDKAEYMNSSEEELMSSLIELLKENKIKFNKINVKNNIQIKLMVEDRFTVLLGTDDNIEEKIKHLSSMIKDISNEKGTINLSMWTEENRQGTFKPEKD